MGTPAPEISPQPAPPPPPSKPSFWQRHGTTAQMLSALFGGFALLVSTLGLSLTFYWHHTTINAQQEDDHIRKLIREQTAPLSEIAKDEHINTLIGDQLKPLNDKLDKLAEGLAYIKGDLRIVHRKLANPGLDPNLLAKSSNPDKALAAIRANLEKAQDRNRILPAPVLVEHRKKVQALPTSATDYWTTVAAIINYQSFVNQKENKAPDPAQIAHRCNLLTEGSGRGNRLRAVAYRLSVASWIWIQPRTSCKAW